MHIRRSLWYVLLLAIPLTCYVHLLFSFVERWQQEHESDCEAIPNIRDRAHCLYRSERERIAIMCQKYLMENTSTYSQSLRRANSEIEPVNQKRWFSKVHKFELCRLPKAGSLSIGMIISNVTGVRNEYAWKTPVEFLLPNNGNASEYANESIYSFVFVRNPVDRLLSGYYDKVRHPNNGIHRSQILKHFNITSENIIISPTEFLRYLSQNAKEPLSLNGHFAPIYTQCHFCTRPYDVIGKLETFDKDMRFVLEKFHAKNIDLDSLHFHRTSYRGSKRVVNQTTRVQHFFQNVSCGLFLSVVKDLFQLDFEMFGYSYKKYFSYCKKV